ncbi:17428_t:CDS:2, partial [Dentiscutata erythropus]
NYGKIPKTNNIRSHGKITSTNDTKTTLKTTVKSQALKKPQAPNDAKPKLQAPMMKKAMAY